MKKTQNPYRDRYGRTVGLYWHVHHGRLLEWCWDYDERREYILANKMPSELEVRLRRFRPVKLVPSLPRALLRFIKAGGLPNNLASVVRQLSLKDRKTLKLIHQQQCPNCPYHFQFGTGHEWWDFGELKF